MDKDLMEFVPNVHFELIPIKNLVSDQKYQRNLSIKHINRAAAHFDPYQINPIKVSRRDGVNRVFNGQHTAEIIALASGSRDTPAWCMVYDELTYEQEAEIFADQMKFVKPLSPYEIFKANIEAGSDQQLIIQDMVESYGLKIGPFKKPGVICAVTALEKIYETYGFNVLNRTLFLLIGTWEGEDLSLSSNMLLGISKLVMTYGDALKDDLFKEKLSKISCKEVCRTAKDRKAGSMGYAEALLIYYNKKSHNALSISQLYLRSRQKQNEESESERETENEVTEKERLKEQEND